MQSEPIKHIAIAGNIGAGKTSLATQLARHYRWDVLYEDASDNPYLADFYFDMNRWSFNLQIHFLHSRYRQVLSIRAGTSPVIQDRTIYEDAHIFAPNLFEMGLMSKRDFESYQHLFQTMSSQIAPPDLLIYLRANIPTLVDHIQSRGRDYEGNMSLDYLKKLNKKYDDWIEQYPSELLIVPVDELDFINRSEDLGKIINMVDSKIHGLFS
ncbi:MAG TPA: deoxynucleoside kinase [Saprospiraceae bacterium]|nr:deoxynucleoside kinase [Saprospiraceae bacterium]HNT18815.1 deoxynucleoside kinase [Saprospiraceae bacterium]